MLRVITLSLFLLVLPFVLYVVYAHFSHRVAQGKSIWEGAPIVWLALAGVAMVLASLLGFATYSGSERGSVYVPSYVVDGKIVPGRFEPVPPPPEPEDAGTPAGQ
jgi:hypothetical protein